ncbi:MAG: glycosyltransferase family 2 protein [Solirubrobacterales bacterium]|nr:glycosyltransferase family 2 protein [Solirubrobacterales bacterium]
MASSPSVSVVIPTHRRREALRRTLLSLGDQIVGPESFEVVVSVDGSEDGTLQMLSELDMPFALRWIAGERRGRAVACNAAIAEARADVLVILDDDMIAAPELIARHLEHHPPGSRACVLGAVPVGLIDSSPLAARYVKDKFDAHLARLGDSEHLNRPRSFYTGNASVRTAVIREVGGFDEGFGFYGNEDVELALRLRAAAVRLDYDPRALAEQRYDKDLRGLERDTFEKGGTTVLLARRHPEVFGELRLASPREHSRPWLAARSALLASTRAWPGLASRVFAVAGLLERLGFWRAPLFYRAALDYAFWAGVGAELLNSGENGELAGLAEDLNRGPIDLLLHG